MQRKQSGHFQIHLKVHLSPLSINQLRILTPFQTSLFVNPYIAAQKLRERLNNF